LLYLWNNAIVRWVGHILVHGKIYRDRLLSRGVSQQRVTYTPLLHLFLSYQGELMLQQTKCAYKSEPLALFFARLEAYKGIDILVEAMRQLVDSSDGCAVVAGKGEIEKIITGPVPGNVEIRNRLLDDTEAIDLFQRCCVVVLPYRDATQSALIAAAYFFGKPVIVTQAGALPEYVVDGETGWVIPSGDVRALADRLRHAFNTPDRLLSMGRVGRAWYEAQRYEEQNRLRDMYARTAREEAVRV
jgi:glycosyltransferase involved in cell wall biosynthesis